MFKRIFRYRPSSELMILGSISALAARLIMYGSNGVLALGLPISLLAIVLLATFDLYLTTMTVKFLYIFSKKESSI